MEYYNSQKNSSEAVSLCHRKPSPFSIEAILGLNQAPPTAAPMTSLPQVEVAAKGQPASDNRPRRRPRTVYTRKQIEVLESAFADNQYPDIFTREDLAEVLDLTATKVLVWFHNRRARHRREAKRNTSTSTSETSSPSSTESKPHQMESTPTSPETSHRLSPETAVMTSQRYTQACCSQPPIICRSASCSSCPPSSQSSYPVNLPSYGHNELSQQYYGGAFTYAYYPHQYAYYYRPSAYPTSSSDYQGNPVCSVPKFLPANGTSRQ
ncbi:uncharacterized protein [Amphiura filiformis]|uniref:uncharacterized protein isoform X1 n=1 Tax=Amphiura filiformis TaxID=82378 RepID=UPI003B21F709